MPNNQKNMKIDYIITKGKQKYGRRNLMIQMIRELNRSKNLEMNMRKYTVKISIV